MRALLDLIFDWLTFGFGVPILIGVGFTLLADEFKAFKAARICFYIAAAWICGKVLMWSVFSSERFSLRAFVIFVVFGVAGVGLSEVLRLTTTRETSSASPAPSPQSTGPATLKFKSTGITFYQGFGSPFVPQRPIKIHAIYENESDAAATGISAMGVIRILGSDPGIDEREKAEWTSFRAGWLGLLQGTLKTQLEGHRTASVDVESNPISNDQLRALRDGTLSVYFMGIIKWTDDTGEWETDICTVFAPNQHGLPDAPAVWHDRLGSAVRLPFKPTEPMVPYFQRANVTIRVLFATNPYDAASKGHILINVFMLNGGPIPATKGAVFVRIGISDSEHEKRQQDLLFTEVKRLADAEGSSNGASTIYPAKESQVTAAYPLTHYRETPLTDADLEQIKAGTKHVFIVGIVKYMDSFGPRETQFCYSLSGANLRLWVDGYSHNAILP